MIYLPVGNWGDFWVTLQRKDFHVASNHSQLRNLVKRRTIVALIVANGQRRTIDEHRKFGMSWKHATTLSKRREIEKKYGIRFTELLRLPYFDTVRFVVVDPMHNILLGSAKLLITLWKDRGIISPANFGLLLISSLLLQISVEFHTKLHHNLVHLLLISGKTGH